MNSNLPTGEFELIAWIRARARTGPRTVLGIGDDCAVLRGSTGADWLVTTDMLMEGRHFLLDAVPIEDVGYKALAVNLSDIAAMAGRPVAAVVAVALPRRGAVETAQRIESGMRPLAERFGVDLVGGDTNAWDGPLVISVTLLGETAGKGPVRRSGARPGDAILVTGSLGGSLLGRHLRPEPRVLEALALNRAAEIHALIDISDGLAADLGHILEESGGLGAIVDEDAVPIHPDALAMAKRDGRTPLEHALGDGEDFELCVVVPAGAAAALIASPPEAVTLYRIGEVTQEPGLRLQGRDRSLVPLPPRGFDHLRSSSAELGP